MRRLIFKAFTAPLFVPVVFKGQKKATCTPTTFTTTYTITRCSIIYCLCVKGRDKTYRFISGKSFAGRRTEISPIWNRFENNNRRVSFCLYEGLVPGNSEVRWLKKKRIVESTRRMLG